MYCLVICANCGKDVDHCDCEHLTAKALTLEDVLILVDERNPNVLPCNDATI